MPSKKLVQSKTLWFNLLSVVAIVITQVSSSIEMKELLGGYGYLLMIAGATVNGILRLFTDKPLEIQRKKNVRKMNPLERELKKDNTKDF